MIAIYHQLDKLRDLNHRWRDTDREIQGEMCQATTAKSTAPKQCFELISVRFRDQVISPGHWHPSSSWL
jgi:hypothetical protein